MTKLERKIRIILFDLIVVALPSCFIVSTENEGPSAIFLYVILAGLAICAFLISILLWEERL